MKTKLPSSNRVCLVGKLIENPKVRMIRSGEALLRARMFMNNPYKNNQGNWQKDKTYIDLVASKELADFCAKHLHKGSTVQVEGQLKCRSFKTKEGQSRSTIEIVASRIFLSGDIRSRK